MSHRSAEPGIQRRSTRDHLCWGFRARMSVSYTAVLDVSEGRVLSLSGLLDVERTRRGTRKDTRALTTYEQAVLVCAGSWRMSGCRRWQGHRDKWVDCLHLGSIRQVTLITRSGKIFRAKFNSWRQARGNSAATNTSRLRLNANECRHTRWLTLQNRCSRHVRSSACA